MLGKSFKIVAPKRFDLFVDDIETKENEAIVKIEKAAVCKADIRYFLGKRDKRVLGLKYPMNLIHEAVGVILSDPTGTFNIGDRVVLVPNLVTDCDKSNCNFKVCSSKKLGENYCPNARFASSNINGFSREFLSYPVSNLIYIPKEIDMNIAVFSELISVVHSIIRRVDIDENTTVGIWGDGIVGYILSSTLKATKKVRVICIGKTPNKLEKFPADEVFLKDSAELANIKIDTAFECVGGKGAEQAVDQIIKVISPGGRIVLAGVSDSDIKINTRLILEKGLGVYGATRSNISDFKSSILTLRDDTFRSRISNLISCEYSVKTISDFYEVFELEASNKSLSKRIINFIL